MAGIPQAERERRDRLYVYGVKQCTRCDQALPLDEFAPRPDGYMGLYGACRGCRNDDNLERQKQTPDKQAGRQKRWRDNNPETWLAISRRRDLRSRGLVVTRGR
ncbi:hypothetical protein [Mycobacterium sp. URHB0021]